MKKNIPVWETKKKSTRKIIYNLYYNIKKKHCPCRPFLTYKLLTKVSVYSLYCIKKPLRFYSLDRSFHLPFVDMHYIEILFSKITVNY